MRWQDDSGKSVAKRTGTTATLGWVAPCCDFRWCVRNGLKTFLIHIYIYIYLHILLFIPIMTRNNQLHIFDSFSCRGTVCFLLLYVHRRVMSIICWFSDFCHLHVWGSLFYFNHACVWALLFWHIFAYVISFLWVHWFCRFDFVHFCPYIMN